jgi:hypothetical protein
MNRDRPASETTPVDQARPVAADEARGRPADPPSLPIPGEVTAANAVFLRLLDATDDPAVRSFLRRIVTVPN